MFWIAVAVVAAAVLTAPRPASGGELLARPQLEQLVAPIALYPDALLGHILLAAGHADQVIEAARWRREPANAALPGDELAAAAAQAWDPSVAALVGVPELLDRLAARPDWMTRLADAWLAQGPALMDAVQALRRRAQAAGNLGSTAEQRVTSEGGLIAIEPAIAGALFVPYFDPLTAYGPWLWTDYPPFGFWPAYGPILRVVVPVHRHWRPVRCDWRGHRIDWIGQRPPGFWHREPWRRDTWHERREFRERSEPRHEPRPESRPTWVTTPSSRPYTIIAPAAAPVPQAAPAQQRPTFAAPPQFRFRHPRELPR